MELNYFEHAKISRTQEMNASSVGISIIYCYNRTRYFYYSKTESDYYDTQLRKKVLQTNLKLEKIRKRNE